MANRLTLTPLPGTLLGSHLVQLADVAPPEAAQEGPQGRWRLDRAADGASRPASAQHVGVVDAVAASQTLPPRKRGADATSVITLSPGLARPGASPRSRCRSTSCGRPRCRANVAGRIRPALLTRRWSSKAIWMRSGWSSGSIFWVLLVSGWFCLSKTIIPDAQEHFLTPSPRGNTHLFGGLGFTVKSAIFHGQGWAGPGPQARHRARTGCGMANC